MREEQEEIRSEEQGEIRSEEKEALKGEEHEKMKAVDKGNTLRRQLTTQRR